MARKRRLEVSTPEDKEQEGEEGLDVRNDRDIIIEGTWEEWFQMVFLKYGYAAVVLFLACIVPLEVLRQLDGDLGLAVAFLTILLIIPIGFFGYLKLWGDGGVWGPDRTDDS